MGPLNGLKVLDLTRVLAGPYCTMILGDLGADIIKVEIPTKGDDARAFGPYLKGESAYFMSLNRNKRSMTLNLKHEDGKNILRRLVMEVDVIIENFRPGTMEKLGLGYEALKLINPEIIYAASSGFGHSGPYSKKPSYDGVVQAMSGLMSITGPLGGEPTRVGPSIGDISAGMFTAIGVLAALNSRNTSGVGQKVDVAMLDCQVAMLENAIARYVVTGNIPKPAGNRHASIVPFEPFDTLDSEIMIAVGNDRLWKLFCGVSNLEAIVEDPKYSTNLERNNHYDELRPIISKQIKLKTTEAWQVIFDDAGVPSGPINNVKQVLANEQVIARDMIVEIDHPVAGKLKMPGIPIKLSETPGEIKTAAPLLGEHTEEILKEFLDFTKEEIKALKNNHVF